MRTTNFNSDAGRANSRMGSSSKNTRQKKNRLASVGNDDTSSVDSDFKGQPTQGFGKHNNERELYNNRKVSASMNDDGKKKNNSILAFSGAQPQENGVLGGAARAKLDALD